MYRIGIIGGGQLGKMMILDAKRLDTYFVILDPTPKCPADSIADEHIVAEFDDVRAFHELAEKVDVVTYEFEHINAEALQELEAEGHKVCQCICTADAGRKVSDRVSFRLCCH